MLGKLEGNKDEDHQKQGGGYDPNSNWCIIGRPPKPVLGQIIM